jgi:hypothetical protein
VLGERKNLQNWWLLVRRPMCVSLTIEGLKVVVV